MSLERRIGGQNHDQHGDPYRHNEDVADNRLVGSICREFNESHRCGVGKYTAFNVLCLCLSLPPSTPPAPPLTLSLLDPPTTSSLLSPPPPPFPRVGDQFLCTVEP